MNYTAISAALLALCLAFYGGMRLEQSNQMRIELVAEKAANSASKRAADAIASIEIKQTVINSKVREIIRTELVYAECKHAPDVYQLIKDKFK